MKSYKNEDIRRDFFSANSGKGWIGQSGWNREEKIGYINPTWKTAAQDRRWTQAGLLISGRFQTLRSCAFRITGIQLGMLLVVGLFPAVFTPCLVLRTAGWLQPSGAWICAYPCCFFAASDRLRLLSAFCAAWWLPWRVQLICVFPILLGLLWF